MKKATRMRSARTLLAWAALSLAGCLEFPSTRDCVASEECGPAATCTDGRCVADGDAAGGDGAAPPADGGSRADGGRRADGAAADGGPEDGAVADAGPDGAASDAGPDGAPPDAGPDGAPPEGDCDDAPPGTGWATVSAGGAPPGEMNDDEVLADYAGVGHTCAVDTARRLFCWGNGLSGQLGHGALERRGEPVRVPGCWRAVSAGMAHTCAIGAGGGRPEGSLWCWGRARRGQLGQPRVPVRPLAAPVRVGADADWTEVSAGAEHTCGVRAQGQLWCWGSNRDARLGFGAHGIEALSPSPGRVEGAWRHVSAGHRHTCGVDAGGGLRCWGLPLYGRTSHAFEGDPHENAVTRPRPVEGLAHENGWLEVSAGGGHTCARHVSGAVVCFGNNYLYQIGIGSTEPGEVFQPRQILDEGATALSAGGHHTCVVTAEGFRCWGEGQLGALGLGGDGVAGTPSMPQPAPGDQARWATIDAGGTHTCAVTRDGRLFCWGDRAHGAVGDGRVTSRPAPAPVVGDEVFRQLSVGLFDRICAITTDGGLRCWGDNEDGTLGTGPAPYAARPTPVGVAMDYSTVRVGGQHACAIRGPTRALECWGLGWLGETGLGNISPRTRPTPVALAAAVNRDWISLHAGPHHTCAERQPAGGARELWCWGDNDLGQIGPVPGPPGGPAAAPHTLVPTRLPAPYDQLTSLAMGNGYTCGLDPDGAVACLGGALGLFFDREDGDIYDGSWQTAANLLTLLQPVPAETPPTDVRLLSSGAHSMCAVRRDPDEIWCAPNDQWGGPPAPARRWECVVGDSGGCAVFAPGGASWVSVSASSGHLCAVDAERRLYCTGDNLWGQLGAGDFARRRDELVEVAPGTAWAEVGVTESFSCARADDGRVSCWGRGDHGTLGDDGEAAFEPQPVPLP